MCLYIVDNVLTCRITYFRYVDMEKHVDKFLLMTNDSAIFS